MWKDTVQSIIEHFENKLAVSKHRVANAEKSAADAPGAMQSWSDKSKDELTQLAAALKKDIASLENTIKELKNILEHPPKGKKVSIGSLVEIATSNGEKDLYFISPELGGDIVNSKNQNISFFILSAKSELGKALLGKKLNDEILFNNEKLTVNKITNG